METNADDVSCADVSLYDQACLIDAKRCTQHHIAQGNARNSYGVGITSAIVKAVGVNRCANQPSIRKQTAKLVIASADYVLLKVNPRPEGRGLN